MFKKAIHFFNGTDKSGRMFKAFIGTIQSERASKLVEFKYWVGRLSDNNAGLFAKEVSGNDQTKYPKSCARNVE